MPEVQRLRVFDECTVDAVERYSFDLSETRVSHRVLDPKHANKNALRAIFGQLVEHKEHVADIVKQFVSLYKTGGWILCAVRPVWSRPMGRPRRCMGPLYVETTHVAPFSQTASGMAPTGGRLERVRTVLTTSPTWLPPSVTPSVTP